MKFWDCTIETEGAGGITRVFIGVEAETKAEAEAMAFEHYTGLADDAVLENPESPTPLTLLKIEVSGGYVVGVDMGQGKDQTAYIACPDCGNPNLQRSGACHVCPICGATTGCS